MPAEQRAAEPGRYYGDMIPVLRSVFGAREVLLETQQVVVDGSVYPLVDDVIVCLDRASWPDSLRQRIDVPQGFQGSTEIARDIQATFGQEWKTFRTVLPEHEAEFRCYFDLLDLNALAAARLCDLGCGMGRWSYFAARYCREIVLVDFSDAIFVAREVMRGHSNAVFVMADVRRLPFAPDFADLIFTLGVLHHLPTPALDEVIALKRYARRLLVYLYYALDNRPAHFRALLSLVTPLRLALAGVRSERVRIGIARAIAVFVYLPLIALGALLRPVGLHTKVPLYETYHEASLGRIVQDAYDRFFTRIEQRFTRHQIDRLGAHFHRVTISDDLPYWHFLCEG